MHFYTNVVRRGNNILYRGIENGVHKVAKIPFKPTLYVSSPKKDTEWTSLYGDNVEAVTFGDINEARDFAKQYEDVHGFKFFGNTNYEYQYICENFPGEIPYDFSQFRIYTIDIETELPNIGEGDGFPNIETANCAVNLITLLNHNTGKTVTFGCRPWTSNEDLISAEKIDTNIQTQYIECESETAMLRRFIDYWSAEYPDFYTGWNTETFDTPYLINRIIRVLGDTEAKRLSPFGILNDKILHVFNKEVSSYEICGVVELDYLALYKKFTYGSQESYSLEHISGEELDTGKLKLGCSFREAYSTTQERWNRFVSYNIIDCVRVKQLDDKLQFVQLVVIMAYMMKCNAKDVFGTVRPWDCMIHGYLYDKKIAIPQKKKVNDFQIEGGYVKDPVPNMYGWTMSFDFASLYPSIIRQWNISPETLLDTQVEMSKDDVISGNIPQSLEQWVGCCVAANGTLYRQEKQGVVPYLMEYMMTGRKVVKKEMLELEQQYQKTKDESLLPRIAMLSGKQMAYKISANSAYGALLQPGFRYYDPRLGEAITLTGQASTIKLGNDFNTHLNKLFKTNIDYVLASDTDSVYLHVNEFATQFCKGKSTDETTKFLDKVGNQLQKVIDTSCEDVRVLCGCNAKVLSAKREAIASQMLIQKKKRYAMVVHNSEGVDYSPYKLKIMGLDLVKSSTPKPIREDLKAVLTDIFFTDQTHVQQKIAKLKQHFMSLSVDEIAFPRSANEIDKWIDPKIQFRSGTPIHVRGAILYNNYTAKNREQYPKLRDGEKIRFIYLKMPNLLKSNAIAWPTDASIPEDLIQYVDYEMMWEKTFIAPVEGLLTAVGWTVSEQSSLEGFFE
jgi:DNA polymerase elongation subunit (family B)